MNDTTAPVFASHAFLRGMSPGDVIRLAAAAAAVSVPAGHRFFEEAGRAANFWLLTGGRVVLDLHVPGQANLIVETLGADDVLGLSWLSPPYKWQFGAEAAEPVAAFEMDGAAVLALCDSRPEFGYQVARRMTAVASRRLHVTRIRMLDLYAVPGRGDGAP